MNIFILSEDPLIAARDQCNKHCVKMIVESAQLLCTALHLMGTPKELLPYKPTHVRHPSTLWLVEHHANLVWLWLHANELCKEYTKRYGKIHKTAGALTAIKHLIPQQDWQNHTPFALAMPAQWKIAGDAVTSYRCYYIAEKSHFAKWHPRTQTPSWWPFMEN
jgi:hypothetical protein